MLFQPVVPAFFIIEVDIPGMADEMKMPSHESGRDNENDLPDLKPDPTDRDEMMAFDPASVETGKPTPEGQRDKVVASETGPEREEAPILPSIIVDLELFELEKARAAASETSISHEELSSRLQAVGSNADPGDFLDNYPKTWQMRLLALETRESRENLAGLEAEEKKYEGLGALRLIAGGARKRKIELGGELESARKEYDEKRAEYVGEKAGRMMVEWSKAADTRAAELLKQRPVEARALGKLYDGYKWLGNQNLEKVWKPESKLGRMAARALSLRTAVSAGLLGAGVLSGAGIASIGIFGVRRLLSGGGAAVGSYDLMRMFSERKERKQGEVSPDELPKMSMRDINERMERMAARAMLGGLEISKDRRYRELQAEFIGRLNGRREMTEADAADPLFAQGEFRDVMAARDASLDEKKKAAQSRDRKRKAIASAIGLTVGGGLLAKGVKEAAAFFIEEDAVGNVAPVPVEARPDVDPAQAETLVMTSDGGAAAYGPEPATPAEALDAKVRELAAVKMGDGYTQIFKRQILVDPEKFGYKPEMGDPDKWATGKSLEFAKKNGLWSPDAQHWIKFDPKNPGRIILNPDGTYKTEGDIVDRVVVTTKPPESAEIVKGPPDAVLPLDHAQELADRMLKSHPTADQLRHIAETLGSKNSDVRRAAEMALEKMGDKAAAAAAEPAPSLEEVHEYAERFIGKNYGAGDYLRMVDNPNLPGAAREAARQALTRLGVPGYHDAGGLGAATPSADRISELSEKMLAARASASDLRSIADDVEKYPAEMRRAALLALEKTGPSATDAGAEVARVAEIPAERMPFAGAETPTPKAGDVAVPERILVKPEGIPSLDVAVALKDHSPFTFGPERSLTGHFMYDLKTDKIMGFVVSGEVGGDSYRGLLKEGWEGTVAAKAGSLARSPNLMRSELIASARDIHNWELAQGALKKAGKLSSPEGKWLKVKIAAVTAAAEKKYGDVFRE